MPDCFLHSCIRGKLILFAASVDPQRALADVQTQCSFGERIPGTPGHGACREWIKQQIIDAGLTLWQQPFETDLPLIKTKAQAFNLWGLPDSPEELGKSKDALFVISAHWDSRPKADREPPGTAQTPFLGANDGGSGVAVALGIARAIKGTPLAKQIVIAFWDAEDDGAENNDLSWCLGSQYAAAHRPAWYARVKFGINLDMIGGKGMKLSREEHSEEIAGDAVKRLWRVGIDLAPDVFVDRELGSMIDDHYSFIREKLPFIDLIGLPYAHWHRITDTPDKCDGAVMSKLGNVLIEFLRREPK